MAENMMIVDLVRNDLAKSSKTGSVEVEEMFGIYAFEQVFQMISTVTSESRDGLTYLDVIKNAFPMGSMTGAPKHKVMQLIELYESSKRGIFSGAAGYISPDGDFDFNVIIRSIFLNMKDNQFSFQVGSAITYDSDPEKNESAIKFDSISFQNVLDKNLKIMDSTAFTLSKENNLPIIVFNMNTSGNLLKLVKGDKIGTTVN